MNAVPLLPRWALMSYGALALPLSFAALPLYIHAPDFYATGAGLALGTIGAALLFIRLLDAALDPLIGILSSHFVAQRAPIMVVAMTVMAISLFLLFSPPNNNVLFWFCSCLAAATVAFSVLTINLNSVGSVWGAGDAEKALISGWREAMGLIGLLVAATLPTLMGFSAYTAALAGLMAFAGFMFLYWHKKHLTLLRSRESTTSSWNWGKLFDRDNLWFFAVYFMSMLASAIPGVLVLFFIRDLLWAESYSGLFLLLYFLSGAAGMPLWIALSRRIGEPRAWLVAMGLACTVFVWAFTLGAGDIIAYGVICILSGFALGAELALPPAILSLLIDRQKATAQTSIHFAVLSFISKAALAAGSFIAFALLGAAAFVPAAANSAASLDALGWTYAFLPCVIKAAAAGILVLWVKSSSYGGNYAYSSCTNSDGGHNGA